MKKPIANGHFQAKDAREWGFKVTSEEIDDDFEKALESVLDRAYAPVTEINKIISIYQIWYLDAWAQTFHEKAVNQLLDENLGKIDESKYIVGCRLQRVIISSVI